MNRQFKCNPPSKLKKLRFSSIWPIDRTLIRCYHSGPERTWERWEWRGTPRSPKLQHYWNLTIKLFSVISRTHIGGVLTLCREVVGVFYSPNWLGNKLGFWVLVSYSYNDINNNNNNRNTGSMNEFISFYLQSFDKRRETQIIKTYANHTLLPQPTGQYDVLYCVVKIYLLY